MTPAGYVCAMALAVVLTAACDSSVTSFRVTERCSKTQFVVNGDSLREVEEYPFDFADPSVFEIETDLTWLDEDGHDRHFADEELLLKEVLWHVDGPAEIAHDSGRTNQITILAASPVLLRAACDFEEKPIRFLPR